ncbi:hypothetical protein SB659_16160 [Arthrobacter sp. SIMBA_036]|uniref:hypothetical protein n=1 Tax=Arthrobacter sp. SIMBA_036 TaxID=3085778 RepID=UPI00397CE494
MSASLFQVSVLRAVGCSLAVLTLTLAMGLSPALAQDCGVLTVVPGACQSPSTQPRPGPTTKATATPAASPAAASPAVATRGPAAPPVAVPAQEAPVVAPAVPATSRPTASVPEVGPQTGAAPIPAIAAPVGPTAAVTAAAPATESPAIAPSGAPAGATNYPQPPGRTGKTVAGAGLLALGGLFVAGAALAGLTGCRPWRGQGGQGR